jgi:hypothetical protein
MHTVSLIMNCLFVLCAMAAKTTTGTADANLAMRWCPVQQVLRTVIHTSTPRNLMTVNRCNRSFVLFPTVVTTLARSQPARGKQ